MHYHITVVCKNLNVTPVTVKNKYMAFAEYGRAIQLVHDMTGLKVDYWDSRSALFEDGSTVRWRECDHTDCAPKTDPNFVMRQGSFWPELSPQDPSIEEGGTMTNDGLAEALKKAQELTIFLRKTLNNRDGLGT